MTAKCYTLDGCRVQGERPVTDEAADAVRRVLQAARESDLERDRDLHADALVVCFWSHLAHHQYTEPVRVYDGPIFMMRTRKIAEDSEQAFMFDDEFWKEFHAFGFEVCHIQWLNAAQTEGGCDDRVFEIRFKPGRRSEVES